jgi:pimeloyl-ACP methyl ester carboxylesterase
MPVSAAGTSYTLSGAEGAPVMALIHGLGLTCDSTFKQIATVQAGRFRMLSYDLCGHGQTAKPDRLPSLTVLSEQLITLMDELAIAQAALVGFSLGGMINRRIAIDHPERVSALAILNSPHERGAEQQKLVEERARDTGAGGPAANLDVTLARWFTSGYRRNHPDKVAQIRDIVLANDPENYAAHRLVLAQGVVELIRPDPPINLPTLVMTCENDSGSTPAMTRAIAAEINGAEVHIVASLQHLGLIEDPDTFSTPIADFLGRTVG